MDTDRERPLATWSAPQCPFTVEYSATVLDDIRLAVVDAFFSLPRGGAEIGGILLGSFAEGRLRIVDYAPIECEHATGPSFTLSERDHARLEAQVGAARANPAGRQPVGWYHSHTRSEIFLSEADLEIHRGYFPEPWQVALVLRPHTFQPARAGFFFRQADGSIRAEASYQEFVLDGQPAKPVPSGVPPTEKSPAPRFRREREPRGPVITVAAISGGRGSESAAAEAAPAPEAKEPDPPVQVPQFLTLQPAFSRRTRRALLAAGLCLALAGGGFFSRQWWLPRVTALTRRAPAAPAPMYLGLNAVDLAGQLQIRWDRNAPAFRNAPSALLEIVDGPQPEKIELDPAHLQAGVFTYARQTEKVDVTLTVRRPDGKPLSEATSFLGRLPTPPGAPESPEIRKQREDLAKESAKLKSDLNAQTERTRRLEKSVDDVRKELQRQQQRRLQNQDPGK